jgi:hypothetical protein
MTSARSFMRVALFPLAWTGTYGRMVTVMR